MSSSTSWKAWGLSQEEWDGCVEAAIDLATLSAGERTPTAEEIAAQLAIAKAARALPGETPPLGEPHFEPLEPHRRLVPDGGGG